MERRLVVPRDWGLPFRGARGTMACPACGARGRLCVTAEGRVARECGCTPVGAIFGVELRAPPTLAEVVHLAAQPTVEVLSGRACATCGGPLKRLELPRRDDASLPPWRYVVCCACRAI